MILNNLKAPYGATQNRKRLGRGESSGLGKTSGRGHKGQKARAGGYHKVGFEGGQMPLQRRLPKRGFTSLNPIRYAIVNLEDLAQFSPNSEVNAEVLKKMGLIKKQLSGVKILARGELTIPLKINVTCCSAAAKEKIEKAGGSFVNAK